MKAKHRPNGWLLVAPLALAALVACGADAGGGTSALASGTVSTATQASPSGSAGNGSAPPSASTPVPSHQPSTTPPSSSTAPSTGRGSTRLCLSGTLRVLYPAADNPLHSSCVHTGAQIVITLRARTPAYRWAPVTSSAPAVVTVLSNDVADNGTRTATARASTPGTATLSSADTYTPDPHGPPSQAWQLTLTVVP
jgi:hypothetical protein